MLVRFLHCEIGDGKIASFWFDYWSDLGPFISLLGDSGPRQLRIPLEATVIKATCNGSWLLPAARSNEALTLQTMLTTILSPTATRGHDNYLWSNAAGIHVNNFSSKATWNLLREQSQTVSWHKVIWFREEIPRCSFITWLVMLSRLPTRDELCSRFVCSLFSGARDT